MALKKRSWASEIADITDSPEFQTCQIRIMDYSTLEQEYDPVTNETTTTGEATTVYEGRARFIPVRAGVFQGGDSQANSATIRAGRIQVPSEYTDLRVNSGFTVEFDEAPHFPALESRVAKVSDDFQGSTTASRTIHVYLDADAQVGV